MSIFKRHSVSDGSVENGRVLVDMYGGKGNIDVVDCCMTRLRITVKDVSKVDQNALIDFGGKGIVINGNATQVIFGEKSTEYKQDMEVYLESDGSVENGRVLVDMYGGKGNIEVVDCCMTRLRITVKDIAKVDQDALIDFGGKGIVINGDATQVIFGEKSTEYKQDMEVYLESDGSVENGRVLVDMYGGKDNLDVVDCCMTRLRITVKDIAKVDKDALIDFGGKGIVINGDATQVIFGEKSSEYKQDMEVYLKS